MCTSSAVAAGRSVESLEAAEGFATSSVTLAHLQPRDTYTRRDKACLFLFTHLYSDHRHTVRSYAGGG